MLLERHLGVAVDGGYLVALRFITELPSARIHRLKPYSMLVRECVIVFREGHQHDQAWHCDSDRTALSSGKSLHEYRTPWPCKCLHVWCAPLSCGQASAGKERLTCVLLLIHFAQGMWLTNVNIRIIITNSRSSVSGENLIALNVAAEKEAQGAVLSFFVEDQTCSEECQSLAETSALSGMPSSGSTSHSPALCFSLFNKEKKDLENIPKHLTPLASFLKVWQPCATARGIGQ